MKIWKKLSWAQISYFWRVGLLVHTKNPSKLRSWCSKKCSSETLQNTIFIGKPAYSSSKQVSKYLTLVFVNLCIFKTMLIFVLEKPRNLNYFWTWLLRDFYMSQKIFFNWKNPDLSSKSTILWRRKIPGITTLRMTTHTDQFKSSN